jgi:hypothetical protein
MSYAASVARDRDKYRRQRDKVIKHLRAIIDVYDPNRNSVDPIVVAARTELSKIFDEPTADKILGL